ncbi:MAG: hypothetical protein MJA82_11595 [Clostridia bacterium]|nr:hypothetical protein [Clostridia bacterium]
MENPIKTIKGIGKALTMKTGKAIYASVKDVVINDIINGNTNTRSKIAGKAALELGVAIIGAKALDKILKADKFSDAGRLSNYVDEIGRYSDDVIKRTGKAGYKYNMVKNPGPLSEIPGNPASNFASGKYNITTLRKDTILYRGGKAGGGKNALGQWFTEAPADSAIHVRIDNAVKPQWIDPKTGALTGVSPIQSNYAVKIPAGTTIYKGPVGYQGGIYLGGQDKIQIFIEKPWLVEGVKPLSEIPFP